MHHSVALEYFRFQSWTNNTDWKHQWLQYVHTATGYV